MSVCVCLVSVCACLHVFVSLCVVICPSPFCIPPVLQIKQFFLGYGGVSIVLPFIRPGKVGATSTQPAMYCHPTQFCLSMCDFLCCLHISLSHSAAGLWTFICCSPQNQVPHIHILHTLHACLTLTGAHTTYASYNTYTASHHTLTTQTTSHHKLPLTSHTTAPHAASHHTHTSSRTPSILPHSPSSAPALPLLPVLPRVVQELCRGDEGPPVQCSSTGEAQRCAAETLQARVCIHSAMPQAVSIHSGVLLHRFSQGPSNSQIEVYTHTHIFPSAGTVGGSLRPIRCRRSSHSSSTTTKPPAKVFLC